MPGRKQDNHKPVENILEIASRLVASPPNYARRAQTEVRTPFYQTKPFLDAFPGDTGDVRGV